MRCDLDDTPLFGVHLVVPGRWEVFAPTTCGPGCRYRIERIAILEGCRRHRSGGISGRTRVRNPARRSFATFAQVVEFPQAS
jgi:hypothetical protein